MLDVRLAFLCTPPGTVDDDDALHHGHAGLRPDVAETEHRAAVGQDGDSVAATGELEALGGSCWISRQGAATPGV